MSKKFMHIMLDSETTSDSELERIYSSLSRLQNSYDIVITTNKTQISTYNQDIISDINEKIDLIMHDLEKFNRFNDQISKQITYVFGLNK